MARNFLKRFIPTPAAIKSNPALQFLGDLLHDPNLFHLNRHSVSVAFFWGLFIALLPIPGQMAVAAGAALIFRCNLPITVALVWLTNPLTMPFVFYICYQVGRFVLQTGPLLIEPEFTWEWISSEFNHLWKPFLTGYILCGLIAGGLGFFGMQFYWRWHVNHNWNKRRKARKKKQ